MLDVRSIGFLSFHVKKQQMWESRVFLTLMYLVIGAARGKWVREGVFALVVGMGFEGYRIPVRLGFVSTASDEKFAAREVWKGYRASTGQSDHLSMTVDAGCVASHSKRLPFY